MPMAHDLLMEPLLSWRDTKRRRGVTTLPGLLARLATGELGDFPRVRTHQFHPWSMFLTQLAAIALHRAGQMEPPATESEWRALLLALTGGAHEPWCLVVDDLSKPAFFQPPVPEGECMQWKALRCPDDLDILVTSKAHDVKESRVAPIAESWVYALTTLQTMQGYPGRGYNPISRMKGGYGNRPRVGLAPDLAPSTRFRRDVSVLLSQRPALLARGFNDHGADLVWVVPWDGRSSLAQGELAPHFIEICWRIRCRGTTQVECAYTTTEARRCLATIVNGDVGDSWIPIERDGGALTVGPSGFHYELLAKLLFGDDFEPAAAQVVRVGDDGALYLLCSALARGQGKTEGLHERLLPVPAPVKRRLGQVDQRAALGRRAVQCIEQAKKMRSKVLFPALKAISLGGKTLEDRFDAEVDDVFFQSLFGSLEQPDEAARLAWERRLAALAKEELARAIDRCPLADAQRFRAISNAQAFFRNGLGKHFPDTLSPTSPQSEEGAQP
ncbi:MAG: type I-E CRISPR-associated protein Cse1/CasA [Myxococcales bacterium]